MLRARDAEIAWREREAVQQQARTIADYILYSASRPRLAGPMLTQAVLEIVIEWFEKIKVASLELPRGWFGRPLGNLHQLTWSAAREHKLLLELDRQLLLILTEPAEAKTTPAELILAGCAQVTLDWQEYGSFKPHVEDHGAGSVRFVSPAALVGRPGDRLGLVAVRRD